MEEDKVLSATDVMAELNISRATLSRLVKNGVINPIEPYNPLLKRQKPFTFNASEIERVKKTPPNPKN
jgi:hypothetical protein